MKKRKGSQNQSADVTSIADKQSSHDNVNTAERKTDDGAAKKESQRPRPRAYQQRGKGGGKNMGPPTSAPTGHQQGEIPSGEFQNFRLSRRI